MRYRFAVVLCAVLALAGHALAQPCPTSGAPVASSPNGANLNEATPITFTWTPSTAANVTGYDVFASIGSPTSSPSPVCSASPANATSCTGPNGGLAAGQYNWVVRANIAGCSTFASTSKQFTVGCLTSAPSAQSPSNGSQNVSLTPTLTWSAVSGATSYDVYLGISGSGGCTSGSPAFTTSTTSFNPTTRNPNTTYEWRVVAKKTNASSCPVTSSTCVTFKTVTQTCNPPGSFNLVAPSNNSTTSSTPTLSWSAASGADKYLIHIGKQNPPDATASDPIVNGSTTTFTFGQALSAGTYYWSVDAYPANCSTGKTSSSVFSFTVAPTASCPTGAPTLNKPANNSTVETPVTFDWSDVSGATSYRLNASVNGAASAVLGVTRDSQFETNLPAGASVDWWVETSADNCTPLASQHFHFNITQANCPSSPGSPTLVSPASGATGVLSPVTFQWTAVSGATSYVVWGISASSTNGSDRFTIGTTTTTQLSATVPQGGLGWYVQAIFGDCPTSTYSKVSTFVVSSPTTCGTSPTTLLTPANNATGLSSPVTFKWTSVQGASGYKLYVAEGNGTGDLAGTTTETTLTTLVPEGTITWWVVTTFAGCADVISAKGTFTSGTQTTCGATATLSSPADGATVSSPVTLSWSAVTGASGYRLWLTVNGSSPILAARSTTATSTSQQLQLSSGSDEWYVETLFSNGCDSTFSTHRKFTVSAAANCDTHKAVTLTAPINSAAVTSPITFSWVATDSAALLYRVWVSTNNEPFSDIGSTKDPHLAHDFTITGSGIWFVESLFENCPSVPSARGTFVIPSPACPTAVPQIVSPPDGTTASAPVTFVWSAVTSATEYRVHWTLNGNDMPVLKTTETSITQVVSPGIVDWHVVAVFDGCPSTRSTKSRFTIPPAQNCSSEGPVLASPANGAVSVDSPVRFDWNPVSNAIAYVLFARTKDGAPTALEETATRTSVKKEMQGGDTEWWVVAFFNGCPPAESAHFRFTVTESNCDNPRPILYTPGEGVTGLASPVHFEWSRIEKATFYKVWAAVDDDTESVIGTTTVPRLTVGVPSGTIHWHVEAFFQSCPSLESATSTFTVRKSPPPCSTPDRPGITAPAQVASNSAYTVRWSAVPNATSYELQEASATDFTNAATQVVTDLAATFTHTTPATPQKWLYRVRAISSCNDERGPYSHVVAVTVLPDTPQKQLSVEVGTVSAIRQTVFIPGQTPEVSFTASTDKPWATVTPSSGKLGPAGVTLTILSDPAFLKLGTNNATVILSITAAGKGGIIATGTAPVNVPISVTTVTPVGSGGKNTPLPNSLIIPAVGHANGANGSLFESDVRLANTSAQAMKYQLNFTLTRTDASQSGESTTIQVDPGATMALDDILTSFFGTGSDGTSALGTLEIRPLTTTQGTQNGVSSIQTVASSRTYNSTPNGTLGQFIPAIPFSQFIAKAADGTPKAILSLQQIANSTAYRTNFGIVEGAGEPASVLIHVFSNLGTEVVAPIPMSLLPGEHRQFGLLSDNGITLTDGRIEVEVVSATGRVTAYASVIDNLTNDPLMVFPVLKGAESSTRYVIPGVADINNGIASWRSDIRLFNPGTTQVTATLAYSPQPNNLGASGPQQITIEPGQVKSIDNALQQLYSLQNSGGSILVTTPTSSKLIVTARTYNQTSSGTYGQFIPAVTPAGSVGLSDNRVLQLLQLESSDRLRTNLGFVETSGNPVTIEVSAIPPDSKVAAKTQILLAANQFFQTSLANFGLGTVYNARVTIKVLSGTGRVTAYGSVIDYNTQDPTYVPAQ